MEFGINLDTFSIGFSGEFVKILLSLVRKLLQLMFHLLSIHHLSLESLNGIPEYLVLFLNLRHLKKQ